VVGVNDFKVEEVTGLERLKVDPAIETSQKRQLEALRKKRDPVRVSELRERIAAVARSSENLIPLFIESVENDVTLGEICHTLRQVWGEYQPQGLM
jgi:methylmalonyl-CoA mutase N-terminal domain/subunit